MRQSCISRYHAGRLTERWRYQPVSSSFQINHEVDSYLARGQHTAKHTFGAVSRSILVLVVNEAPVMITGNG